MQNVNNFLGGIPGNFLSSGGSLISSVENGISAVVGPIESFGSSILSAAQSSITSISSLVSIAGLAITGYEFGRYALGNSAQPQGQIAGISGIQSTTALIAAAQTQAQETAAANQATVIANVAVINSDAANNSSSLATDIITAISSLQLSIADPATQIATLINFCSFQSNIQQSTSLSQIEQATASLCRRAALSSLATACASYQPTSTTGAYAIINSVRPVFQSELTYTANGTAANDAIYQSLNALYQSTIADLQARATNLPSLVQRTFNVSLPSVILANLLYGDPTRQNELVSFNNTVANPLFMPNEVFCLAS